MMRKLFMLGTAIFWLCVLTIWIASRWQSGSSKGPQPAAEKRFSLSEIARHASEDSCWMAINGNVYDLSAYLPQHPSKPSIVLPWCGKEASEAYRTKTKGRPHSPEADQLLMAYRIGAIEDASTDSTKR